MRLELALQKSAETSYAANISKDSFRSFFDETLSRMRISVHKDGPAFVPSKLRNSARSADNVVFSSLIVFDIDQTPEDEVVAVDEAEDALLDLGFEHAIYTSYSNSLETPRFRIVIPVSRPIYPNEYMSVTAAVLDTIDEMLGGKLIKVVDRCWKEPSRCYYLFTVHPDRQKGAVAFYNCGDPVNVDEMKLVQCAYGFDPKPSAISPARSACIVGGSPGRSYGLARCFSSMYGCATEREITDRIMQVDATDNAGNEYFRDYQYARFKPRPGESADAAALRSCRKWVRDHIDWLSRKQRSDKEKIVSKRAESREPMPTHDAMVKIRSVNPQKTKQGGETALVELQVMSGNHAGRHFWHRFYGDGNHCAAIDISRQIASQISQAAEADINSLKDLVKIEGALMRARIKHKPGTNGFPAQNEIGCVYP